MAEKIPVHRYNGSDAEKKAIHSQWWNESADEMHAHIFGVVARIRETQSYRSLYNLKFARLYCNLEILGLQAGLFARVQDPSKFLSGQMSYNVIKSCVDTAASKIAKNKPRPLFLTEDGDWSLQRKAQKLTAFMEGAFDSMGTGLGDNRTLYGISRRAWVDGAVFGTGGVKFYADHEEKAVKAERVLIEEIVVDETEGMYESPRQIHQEKLVPREVLADLFPSKYRDKIKAAQSGISAEYQAQCSADMLKVVESWHLPSGKNADDGRKVISIENCTLDVDDWKKDYFPFLFHRWSPRLLGFYGMGLAEELIGIQLEINKLLRTIAIAQHLMSVPQVWLEMQNKVNAKQINNEIGGVKFYTGQPPLFNVPNAMSAEVYQHLENLYRKAYEITGISMLSAASKKPTGIDSAVALREYQDIESDRFMLVGQRYEDFFVDAAYMTMDLMSDLEAAGVKPRVKVKEGQGFKDLSWSSVKMDKDQLKIRAFPTALLPSQPAGKLQKVQEMTQAGFFEKDEAMELLDFPDLKGVVSLKTSARQDARRMIEKMIDQGVEGYETPEPFMNLELTRQLAQSYYLKGRTEGMPEDRLELLRRLMDDCQALLTPPALPPTQDMVPAMPGAPGAVPGPGMDPLAEAAPPPVSDLLPITA